MEHIGKGREVALNIICGDTRGIRQTLHRMERSADVYPMSNSRKSS